MTERTNAPLFETAENRKAVQKAWRAGRRKITIDGRQFDLKKAAGTTTFAFSKTDDRPKGRQEKYILVTPTDGSLTPMGQVAIPINR